MVKPIMERFPQAWTFFIIFIVCTTFMALNLFIGVVVNAMQAEVQRLRDGVAALHAEIRSARGPG